MSLQLGEQRHSADCSADRYTAPLRLARPRGRLLAPGSLVLGMGLFFSAGLDAANKSSFYLKIVIAICN